MCPILTKSSKYYIITKCTNLQLYYHSDLSFDQRRYIFKIGLALNYDRKIEMK